MEKTRKSQKKKRSDKFINTAVILLLIAGLCIMLYPAARDPGDHPVYSEDEGHVGG